jgi:hypothetical protein
VSSDPPRGHHRRARHLLLHPQLHARVRRRATAVTSSGASTRRRSRRSQRWPKRRRGTARGGAGVLLPHLPTCSIGPALTHASGGGPRVWSAVAATEPHAHAACRGEPLASASARSCSTPHAARRHCPRHPRRGSMRCRPQPLPFLHPCMPSTAATLSPQPLYTYRRGEHVPQPKLVRGRRLHCVGAQEERRSRRQVVARAGTAGDSGSEQIHFDCHISKRV